MPQRLLARTMIPPVTPVSLLVLGASYLTMSKITGQESEAAQPKPARPSPESSNMEGDLESDPVYAAGWPHSEEDLRFPQRDHSRTRSIAKTKNDEDEKAHVATGHPNPDDSQIATAEAAEDFVGSMFGPESTADLENETASASQSHGDTSAAGRETALAVPRKERTKDCERIGVHGNMGILEPMNKAYAGAKVQTLVQELAEARGIREGAYRMAREERGSGGGRRAA